MAFGALGFLLAVDQRLEMVIAFLADVFEYWHERLRKTPGIGLQKSDCKTSPQRLKPASLAQLSGTAEAVPFPKAFSEYISIRINLWIVRKSQVRPA
jgi:hypothetical protein